MEVLTLGQAQRGPCTALLHKGKDAAAPLRIPRSFSYLPTSTQCTGEEFSGLGECGTTHSPN